MPRVFNSWTYRKSWTCPRASLFIGTAIAFSVFSSVKAGDEIKSPANRDIFAAVTLPAQTDLLVDWNENLIIQSGLNTQDTDRPVLADLSPDGSQDADATSPFEEAGIDGAPAKAMEESTRDNDAAIGKDNSNRTAPAADTNLSDVSRTENESKSDTTDKTSDDADYSQPESVDPGCAKYQYGLTHPYYGENAEGSKAEEAGKSDEAAKTEETIKAEETGTSEDTTKSSDSASTTNPGDARTETNPDSDFSSPLGIEEYYGYLYRQIEGRYGDNANESAKDEAAPAKDDSSNMEESDDDSASSTDDTDGNTADADQANGSAMADALLGVASLWAEEFASSCWLRIL